MSEAKPKTQGNEFDPEGFGIPNYEFTGGGGDTPFGGSGTPTDPFDIGFTVGETFGYPTGGWGPLNPRYTAWSPTGGGSVNPVLIPIGGSSPGSVNISSNTTNAVTPPNPASGSKAEFGGGRTPAELEGTPGWSPIRSRGKNNMWDSAKFYK